ncbi:MAG: hypothetical protein ALAOOOJD_04736 [bacterium]|nr:hypothetical protein [bacterium]
MRGFTRSEQGAILFLLTTFGAGVVVWWFRQNQPLPAVDPAEVAALEAFVRVAQSDSGTTAALSASAPTVNSTPQSLDVNAATFNDLVRLPGIGPVMAKRIIEYREANGPFKRLQDLRHVKGIGAKTYEKLAPLLVVQ